MSSFYWGPDYSIRIEDISGIKNITESKDITADSEVGLIQIYLSASSCNKVNYALSNDSRTSNKAGGPYYEMKKQESVSSSFSYPYLKSEPNFFEKIKKAWLHLIELVQKDKKPDPLK